MSDNTVMMELQYCPLTFLEKEMNIRRNWQGNYVIRYTLRTAYRRNTSSKRYSSNRLQEGGRGVFIYFWVASQHIFNCTVHIIKWYGNSLMMGKHGFVLKRSWPSWTYVRASNSSGDEGKTRKGSVRIQSGINSYFYVLRLKFYFCMVYVTTLSVCEIVGFRRDVLGAFALL